MNVHVQWFGYEAVRRGLLTGEELRELGQVLGDDADLITFAQAVIDHALCDDYEGIQELVNVAWRQGESDVEPPLNVFAVAAQPAAAEPAAPRPRPPSGSQALDMPDLDAVGALDDDDAADLMRQLLIATRQLGASDLHLSAAARPFVRHQLRMQYIGNEPLSRELASQLNTVLLDDEQKTYFAGKRDLDYALAFDDQNRFRVNLMVHKDGVAGTYRLVPDRIETLEDLGFKDTKTITKLLAHHNGLILVTGPLGSGKTTTLAALVDHLNGERRDHIITVEDPIEIIQDANRCNITQREVGDHTDTFGSALKAALREDPDIIVIGELRDLTTIEMAITAAETGHLVIGTLHTRDATTTLGRMLDVFPPSQQQQIRSMTAESLRGIVCQRLLPTTDGGVTVAAEILINTIAVASVIRENKMHQLGSIMQTGRAQGMCTMDEAVMALFEAGRISQEVALANVADSVSTTKIKEGRSAQPKAAEVDETEKSKRKWFR